MAWERRGKHRYLYRNVRVDGRFRKQYLGRGPLAVAMDHLMTAQRSKRKEQQAYDRGAAETLTAADAVVTQAGDAAGVLAASQVGIAADTVPGVDSFPPLPTTAAGVIARVRELVAARAAGDPTAEAELRCILAQFPELWAQLGDLGEQAIELWLNLLGGNDTLLKDAVREKLHALQRDLSAMAHDPASRLLVDRVVATWMQVQYADMQYAGITNTTRDGQEFIARRQQQAQRQHLAALQAWRQWQQATGQRIAAKPPAVAPAPAPTVSNSGDDSPTILPFKPRSSVSA